MQESILLNNLSQKDLIQLFNDGIKSQFENLKKELNPSETNELMTREETYKFLKIDSSTLWHWTNKGKVIAYGIGNRRYYKKAEILESLIPLNQ